MSGKEIHFVTGCAGFIGSNLTDRLLSAGYKVIGYDNFSTGKEKFLENALKSQNFSLIRGDLLDFDFLKKSLKGGIVWHFAANADVRFGLQKPRIDLEQNTIATSNVLEAARINGVHTFCFSSTGSIYGEAKITPTPEEHPFPIQTSLYGASKLACEGLIEAYCEGFNMRGIIFRFVSILGERYAHGHVFDFVRQLKKDAKTLKVLGDGNQKKSYLYIQDCINACFKALEKTKNKIEIYNLGADEYVSVKDSISYICARLGVEPALEFSGGNRGWIGDNPFIFLETAKIKSLGWKAGLSIKEAVEKTVDYLLKNIWILGD